MSAACDKQTGHTMVLCMSAAKKTTFQEQRWQQGAATPGMAGALLTVLGPGAGEESLPQPLGAQQDHGETEASCGNDACR